MQPKVVLVEDRRAKFKASRGVANIAPLGQRMPYTDKAQYPGKFHGREIALRAEARLAISPLILRMGPWTTTLTAC